LWFSCARKSLKVGTKTQANKADEDGLFLGYLQEWNECGCGTIFKDRKNMHKESMKKPTKVAVSAGGVAAGFDTIWLRKHLKLGIASL
jgi:hypothetical protein